MPTQTEKLDSIILENIKQFQATLNQIFVNLGQIEIRTRELNKELKRLSELKDNLETEFENTNNSLNEILKELETKYSKAEIDLEEGTIIYQAQ